MGIVCQNCNSVVNNSIYCDNCGKLLISSNDLSNESSKLQHFAETELKISTKSIKSNLKVHMLFKSENDFIKEPFYIDDINEIIYFNNFKNESSLKEYIGSKLISYKDIKIIMKRFIDIFMFLEKRNIIVNAINFDDFYIFNNDIETLFLKLKRSFINLENLSGGKNQYYYGEDIIPPECLDNINYKDVDKSTNVYILGNLFCDLIFNGFDFSNKEQKSYYLYNISLFRNDVNLKFHDLINRSISIFKEERVNSIKEFKEIYDYIINQEINTEVNTLVFDFNSKTDVGKSKFKKGLSKLGLSEEEKLLIKEEDFNEDSYFTAVNYEDGTYLFAVADGVSTSTYGTGKEASNILKQNLIEAWEEFKSHLIDESSVKEFLDEVISQANNEIINRVKGNIPKDLYNSGHFVMASTLVVGIVIKNTLYYASLGDSKIFIYNDLEGLNILNYEDNYGNMKLLNGVDWYSYSRSEDNDVLVKYVGGVDISNNQLNPKRIDIDVKKIKLNINDILIFCSDGVTDYLCNIAYSNNIWEQDLKLKELINKSKNINICDFNGQVINEANNNGGGDNITIVAAKVIGIK